METESDDHLARSLQGVIAFIQQMVPARLDGGRQAAAVLAEAGRPGR
jgi:hypothetical protein